MEEARLQQGAHCRLIRAFWAGRPLLLAPTEGPPLTTDPQGQWGPQLSAAANVLNSLGGSFLHSRWDAKGIISFQHGGKGRKWQPLTRLLTQSKDLVLNCCEGCLKRSWSATGVGENKGFSGQVHNSARSAGGNGATFDWDDTLPFLWKKRQVLFYATWFLLPTLYFPKPEKCTSWINSEIYFILAVCLTSELSQNIMRRLFWNM